ncbi:MAG TPA: zinc-ribbon domain-containing protein [Chthonomonadaceae bacterium]|nr:zinc-ribbon domain-containing protein [Chthonomonadaceae bacterium]
MQCPRCGASVSDDFRFCPHCGQERTALEAAPSQTKQAAAAPAAVRQSAETLAPAAASAEVAPAGDARAASDTGRLAPQDSLGSAPAGASDKDAVRTLLSQANLYRLRGLWAGAVDRCIAVLKIQPDNHTAHSLLGDIYRDQDKIEDAIQWYRMAIQLRPNPSDEAKLKQMERERARQQRAAESRARAEAARTRTSPVSAGATAATGTAALLGISPRRWLRGMTLVSVAFLMVVIIALIALQMNRNHTAASASLDNFPNTTRQAQPLPPAQRTSLAANTPTLDSGAGADGSPSEKVVSGGGMPPDHPDSAAASTTSSTSRKARADAAKQKSRINQSVTTASVLDTQPAQVGPGFVLYENLTLPPDPSAVQVKLPGGLQLAEVRMESGSTCYITINAPSSFRKRMDEDRVRALMIRTVYRASRSIFHVLQNASMAFVIFKTPGDTNELMRSEIDRSTALSNNPDSQTALALQQRLIMVNFSNNQ